VVAEHPDLTADLPQHGRHREHHVVAEGVVGDQERCAVSRNLLQALDLDPSAGPPTRSTPPKNSSAKRAS
jgi:hypothetical protein